jgi:hypothetical protein
MAFITTVGLLWMLDYPFSNILTVVPFLVITIGIDDAFLILAGWRHSNLNADFEVFTNYYKTMHVLFNYRLEWVNVWQNLVHQ